MTAMTDWRSAFFAQARSDNEARKILNQHQTDIPYCHQLHYLQMFAEKLAKGWAHPISAPMPPRFTHAGLVALLQAIRNDPTIWQNMGYADLPAFQHTIDSLVGLAQDVQRLAPSMARNGENPEYPWGPEPSNGQDITAPCNFDFHNFDPTDTKMVQLIRLLEHLLTLG